MKGGVTEFRTDVLNETGTLHSPVRYGTNGHTKPRQVELEDGRETKLLSYGIYPDEEDESGSCSIHHSSCILSDYGLLDVY